MLTNHVVDIYYHKNINFIQGHFVIINGDLYDAINYTIKMPTKEFSLEIDKLKKDDTVEDLARVLEIPDMVESITVPLDYCGKEWRIVRNAECINTPNVKKFIYLI